MLESHGIIANDFNFGFTTVTSTVMHVNSFTHYHSYTEAIP